MNKEIEAAIRYYDWIKDRLIVRADAYVAYLPNGERKSLYDPDRRGKKKRVDRSVVNCHVAGIDPIALYAISRQQTCRWIAWDCDNHDGESAIRELNIKYVCEFAKRLREIGLDPLVESSDGQGGFHVWVVLNQEIASHVAFSIAHWAIEKLHPWHGYLNSQPECFPAQGRLSETTKYGNALRLPGRHPSRRAWSSVLDRSGEKWIHWPDAIGEIVSRTGDSIERIPDEAKAYIEPAPPPVKPSQAQQQIMFELYGPPLATSAPTSPYEQVIQSISWSGILEPYGWSPIRTAGKVTYWRRPGKDGPDHSATTGFCGDTLYVFSNSACGFAAGRAYSKYQAMAVLRQVIASDTRRRTVC